MKKIYFFLVTFFTIFISNAQIINFPDANFKAKLLSATTSNNIAKNVAGTSIKIDTNNNGQIEQSEAVQVYRLFEVSTNLGGNVPFRMANSRMSSQIVNLTGIAYFTNLRHLNVSSNLLTTIDISSNIFLQELYCVGNQLTSINLNSNLALKTLSIASNQLTILNLSNNTLLEGLNCNNNQLTTLNLNGLNVLKYIYANYNNLASLNTNSQNQLNILFCNHNLINNLNLNNNPQIQYLDFSFNLVTNINLSANNLLVKLYTDYNSLTSLSVTGMSFLTVLSCSSNQISTLNLNGLTNLFFLYCSNNLLSNLSISNLPNIKRIFCNNNQLSSINLSNLSQLGLMYCGNNILTSLDLSQTSIQMLDCQNNPNLSFINIKNNSISPEIYTEDITLPPLLPFNFENLNSLTQICCDSGEISLVQQYLTLNPNNILVGDLCSGKSIAILKLNIQGYYDSSIQKMRPFKSTTTSTTITNNADDITVELRNTSGALIASTITALKTSGNAVCLFNNQPIGSYYVVVKHRNSIETWSANPVTIGSTPLTYNFTNAASKAYGSNMIQVESGIFAIYSGDLNQDQVIDNSDATNLFNDIENSAYGYLTTDLNGDGAVDNSDTILFFNNTENSIYSLHP